MDQRGKAQSVRRHLPGREHFIVTTRSGGGNGSAGTVFADNVGPVQAKRAGPRFAGRNRGRYDRKGLIELVR